ncbi:cardiolipin synthetase [Rhodobacteraceae bacterium 2CG4]|uniref:Phospholipase D n=1 Tax=Halovulum marinum TaxID=2662447 RepID=A0A6L5Z4S3_9RHOB|nr:phospholipase D-like domain-containing protein [Halovulum marinum]MSU91032.1 cardiolipin synthetase [Halovulum marinum]
MHWLAQHALIVLGVLVTTLAVIFVLQQRRTAQSTAAWVLFIVVVPYVAIPLFLMLGFRKQGTRFPPVSLSMPVAGSIADSRGALSLAKLGALPATKGNKFTLHDSAQSANEALQETIESANDSLDVIFYIVAPDQTGKNFVDRLTEKARAGVKVRLNLDRLGSLKRPRAELKELQSAGGEVRYFSPFIHPPDNGHMNLRNHRKLVVADRARVWSGGRNIGDHYLGPKGRTWTDLSFCVSGPAVQPFMDVFASDWDVTGKAVTGAVRHQDGMPGGAVLQVIPSGPDEPGDTLYLALLTMIHRARRRVWISTPYFVPTEPLQLALSTAVRKGLDVRIMVPERSNQPTTDFARGSFLRHLQEIGASVLRHQGGMLHAKSGLIDDTGWVGSANFDMRSLLLNFEIAMFCHDKDSNSRLESWFQAQFEICEPGVAGASLPRRVVEGVFRLGAPVL